MSFLFGGGGGDKEAERARKEEQARQQEIRQGTRRVNNIFDNQFDKPFFREQRRNFIDYANPQLENQYGDAQKELTFSLARGGNLDSSTRGEQVSELQKLYDLNKQKVADDARAYATTARQNVEDARSGLITTLQATGDAQGAANQAISRAGVLSQPPSYNPLTDLFAQFTSGLGTQAALEKANAYSGGQVPVRYNTGLFSPSKSVSVKP